MIDQQHRFHGYGGVRAIQRQGKSEREQFMSLKYLTERPEGRPYRAAVVVGRKVSKIAPTRNRIRRRLYEIIRLQPIKGGADLVLSAFDESLADMEHGELEKRVQKLLKSAKLLQP